MKLWRKAISQFWYRITLKVKHRRRLEDNPHVVAFVCCLPSVLGRTAWKCESLKRFRYNTFLHNRDNTHAPWTRRSHAVSSYSNLLHHCYHLSVDNYALPTEPTHTLSSISHSKRTPLANVLIQHPPNGNSSINIHLGTMLSSETSCWHDNGCGLLL